MGSGRKADRLWTQARHLPNQQPCNLNLSTRKGERVSYFFVNKPPARKIAPKIRWIP